MRVPAADLAISGIAVVHAGVDRLAQIVARLVRVGRFKVRGKHARQSGVRRRLIGDAAAKQHVQRGLRHVALRVRLLCIGKGGERQLGLRHVGDLVGVRVVHGLEPQIVRRSRVDPHLRRRFVVDALELFERVVAADAHPDGEFNALFPEKSAHLIPCVNGESAHIAPCLADRFPGVFRSFAGGVPCVACRVAHGTPGVAKEFACRIEEVALFCVYGQGNDQQQRRQQQTKALFHKKCPP